MTSEQLVRCSEIDQSLTETCSVLTLAESHRFFLAPYFCLCRSLSRFKPFPPLSFDNSFSPCFIVSLLSLQFPRLPVAGSSSYQILHEGAVVISTAMFGRSFTAMNRSCQKQQCPQGSTWTSTWTFLTVLISAFESSFLPVTRLGSVNGIINADQMFLKSIGSFHKCQGRVATATGLCQT